MLIGDRQGVAVDPVPGPEVALEVGGPQIVGLGGRRGDDPGMVMRLAPPALLRQAAAREQIARRADGGLGNARMPGLEPLQNLLRPPAGMRPPGRTEELGDVPGDPVRTVVRGPAPVLEAPPTLLREAGQPLVA